ncbi:adenosylmethionine--8-amino-7-oxononanoate aminotransferase BioA, partial [Methylobacterium hispanicum]
GAIGAVQFASPPDLAALKARLAARGVWVRPFGDIAYLTPALTIGSADLDHLLATLAESVTETGRSARLS